MITTGGSGAGGQGGAHPCRRPPRSALQTAQADNRRVCPLSALRAHTKSAHHGKARRALERPGRAQAERLKPCWTMSGQMSAVVPGRGRQSRSEDGRRRCSVYSVWRTTSQQNTFSDCRIAPRPAAGGAVEDPLLLGVAGVVDLPLALAVCPSRESPFLAVKRHVCPHKSAIQNRFNVRNAKGTWPPRAGPGSGWRRSGA